MREAMTRARDELANNLAKLSAIDDRKSEVEKHLARERQKLTETDDIEIQQDIRDRIEKLKGELSDIELERQARLEALSTNRAALQSQINRIRETIMRLLHEDKTLAERIRTLPRTGDNDREHPYSNRHGDKHSRPCCHWRRSGGHLIAGSKAIRQGRGQGVDKKAPLQALGRALANLAGKAAAALPSIIGSIVCWLLSTLGKAATWLADNVWALVIGVGALLLVAARDWLARQPTKAPLGQPRPLRL